MEEMIKVIKPTGEDTYKILSAFKANEMDFVVLDSKLKDPNGNTITYIAQIDGNQLKYIEGETWDLVRNALITIVKGIDSDYKHKVPFTFINVANEYEASENVGHTLGLKDVHVSSINSQYKAFAGNEVTNVVSDEVSAPTEQNNTTTSDQPVDVTAEQTADAIPVIEPEIASKPAVDTMADGGQEPVITDQAETPTVDESATMGQPEEIVTGTTESADAPVVDLSVEEQTDNIINDQPASETSEESIEDTQSDEISIMDADYTNTASQDVIPSGETDVAVDNQMDENLTGEQESITGYQAPDQSSTLDELIANTAKIDIGAIADAANAMDEQQSAVEEQASDVENSTDYVNELKGIMDEFSSLNESYKAEFNALTESYNEKFNLLNNNFKKIIEEKQQMIDAKLEIANIAFDNAQKNTMDLEKTGIDNAEQIVPDSQKIVDEAGPVLQKVA